MALIDKNQNWKLLASAQTNGYTIFKFTRPLILCDSDDRTIEVKNKIKYNNSSFNVSKSSHKKCLLNQLI